MADLDAYLDKFSESGKRIFQIALNEAHRRDQNIITPEHILYALIAEEINHYNETMNNLSIDPQAFRLAIEKRLENSHQAEGSGFRISPETTEILKYSMDRARSQGRRVIDTEDICHVIAFNKESLLDDILLNPKGLIPLFHGIRRIVAGEEANRFRYQSNNKGRKFFVGSFVEVDGLLGVIVGLSGQNGVSDDHLAIRFGEPQTERISEGGSGGLAPIVWTVPTQYCLPSKPVILRH